MDTYREYPLRSMSIADWNRLFNELLTQQREDALLHFALSGTLQDPHDAASDHDGENQPTYQAVIDHNRNEIDPRHPLEVMRDYDSMIGLDVDIVVNSPLLLYPVAMDNKALTKSNHLVYPFLPDDQANKKVPLHCIPNVQLGFWSTRHMVHIFFPHLYRHDRSNSLLSDEEKRDFYEKGLHPAVSLLNPFDKTEWPPAYDAEKFRAMNMRGGMEHQTKCIPAWEAPELVASIRRHLEENNVPWHQGIFVCHTIRGTKSTTRHELDARSGRQTLDEFLVECSLTREVIARPTARWYIDVGLDIKSALDDPECLQWRTSSHFSVVKGVLQLNDAKAARITSMGSSKYSRDFCSHLTGVAGCRIEPGIQAQGNFEAVYFQMYTTDKSVTYHPEGRFSAKAMTTKMAMGECQPVPFLTCLYETYKAAARQISSNARVEVRVPFKHATSVLLNVPGLGGVLRNALLSFKREDWWKFRAYRAMAISKLLTLQAQGAPALRVKEEALLLTAAAVWLINGLHARPDDHQSCRALMKCVLRLGDGDINPNIVPYPTRNRQATQSADEDSEGGEDGEDDFMVAIVPYGAIFLRPLMIEPDVPRMRVGGGFLDENSFKWFFNASLQEIRHKYNSVGIIPRRALGSSQIVANRQRQTKERTTLPSGDDDEPRMRFNLGDRGYKLNPPPQDDGSDLGENNNNNTNADKGDIDAVLTRLWHQFLTDITLKSPNAKGRAHQSYFKLTQDEREQVSEDVFKNIQLSDVWRAVQWKPAPEKEWETAFENLFPPPGHLLSSTKSQNYAQCFYYQNWKEMCHQQGEETITAMRKVLKQKVFSLAWIPGACSDRIWATGPKAGFKTLPTNMDGGPAPRILMKHFVEPKWNQEEGV